MIFHSSGEKGGGGERDAGVVRGRSPGSAAPGVIITRRPKPLSLSLSRGWGGSESGAHRAHRPTDRSAEDQFLEGSVMDCQVGHGA